MDCVSPILDVATRFWDCTSKRAVYVRELQENLDSLKSLTQELADLSKDVVERVEFDERLQQSRRTHQVDGWLRAVQLMQAEIDEILRNGDQEIRNKCLGGSCPRNCRTSYKLGKMVTKKIVAVTDLMGKGRHFDVVAHRLPPPPVDQIPMGKTLGFDSMWQEVRTWLEDEKVRRIGLYGIGGVGKTTLLQKINNEYFGATTNDFDVVIWVVVSKPINIENIQQVILKKLGTPAGEGKREREMAAQIFKLLKPKKFAILLDDMWEGLDLLQVGIPPHDQVTKLSKVVFTTRSEQVCYDMQADKRLKVECLSPDAAFSLFCHNIGGDLLNSHPDITRLAKIVAEECRGLPLALVVTGRSMASRKTPQDWEQAVQQLKSTYPAKFAEGMGGQVFPILKFSYDHLDNDIIKSCFLYCSLFPEDHIIMNEDLLNLWIGEGLLDNFSDIYEARRQGEEIIRSLKLACLLEGDTTEDQCKMHDVIRDMALRISCGCQEEDQKHKSFVLHHVELVEAHETMKYWKEARRIAFWNSYISAQVLLPLLPACFINLRTLILRNNNMAFPIGFFQNMPVIRVLDLENNKQLHELPLEICRLESLEYLSIGWTKIKRIPVELKNLAKLRCLILDNIFGPMVIPPNVISRLSNLQMFSMVGRIHREFEEVEVLQELECLDYLGELNISLTSLPAVKKFLRSQKLQKCIRTLRVFQVEGAKEVELPLSTLQRLKRVYLGSMYDLEHVKIIITRNDQGKHAFSRGLMSNSSFHNLVSVSISGCHGVLGLSWLCYAPSLEKLSVCYCYGIEEIIGRSGEEGRGDSTMEIEEQSDHFSRLAELRLEDLPNLRSIYSGALPFPSLKGMIVLNCPKLRKLPLNSSSACTNTLTSIKGESRWWEELEWENDNLKHTFDPYFKSRDAKERRAG